VVFDSISDCGERVEAFLCGEIDYLSNRNLFLLHLSSLAKQKLDDSALLHEKQWVGKLDSINYCGRDFSKHP
jgi:hypothetical protein